MCESPRLLPEVENGEEDELVEEGNESLGICRQVSGGQAGVVVRSVVVVLVWWGGV